MGAQRVSSVNAVARWQHNAFHLVTLLCTRCLLALFYLFSHAIVFFQLFNSASVLFPSPLFFTFQLLLFFFTPEAAFNLRHLCYLGQIVCLCLPYVVCAGVYVCVSVCADQADCDRWLVFTFASFCSLFSPFSLDYDSAPSFARRQLSRIIDRLLCSPLYPFFKLFCPPPLPPNIERRANYARKDRIFQKE